MKNIGEVCKLSDLKVRQLGKLIKLNENNKPLKRHLLDMGLTRGTEIRIKRIAPMGDPIEISLRDYELCMCKENLEKIDVEVIE